jgi:DNA-binding response OmpR family regulator
MPGRPARHRFAEGLRVVKPSAPAPQPLVQPHILVAGEDRMVGRPMSEYLKDNGFRVTTVHDDAGVLQALDNGVVDMVLLASSPEGVNAVRLAQQLREQSPLGIIVLNSRGEEADLVMALELGADDCLTKPFSLRELLARVRALLRRRQMHVRQHKANGLRAYRFDDWELNLHTRRIARDVREAHTALSNGEFSVLVALLGAGGRILSRTQLLELSRLHDDEVYDRSVDVQISRLRQKIEPEPARPRYVLTERGAGYRFGMPVQPVY